VTSTDITSDDTSTSANGRLLVCGFGNALLDVIARDPEGVIDRLGLIKGSMQLVDAGRAEEIYSAMGPTIQVSGGSAANTIAGVASLGGASGYVGRVGDDEFGEVFTHDLRALGVETGLAVSADGVGTGRCHVFVADDAQRTMATFLGAANQLRIHDISDEMIAQSEIVYLEGYLFDLPPAKEAFRHVVRRAHDVDALVALSLSDSFCVDRHRGDFLDLVTGDVDILLANESEAMTLFQAPTLSRVFDAADELGVLTVVTTGPQGAQVSTVHGTIEVPAAEVSEVVDQNGAGDLFAAGFLFALATGADPVEAAQLGSLCAGEVIGHLGARPETDLLSLASSAGLL
jgi:sugar/nucleoside kinase (ribokinase family)